LKIRAQVISNDLLVVYIVMKRKASVKEERDSVKKEKIDQTQYSGQLIVINESSSPIITQTSFITQGSSFIFPIGEVFFTTNILDDGSLRLTTILQSQAKMDLKSVVNEKDSLHKTIHQRKTETKAIKEELEKLTASITDQEDVTSDKVKQIEQQIGNKHMTIARNNK
jgi:hypothetical protein